MSRISVQDAARLGIDVGALLARGDASRRAVPPVRRRTAAAADGAAVVAERKATRSATPTVATVPRARRDGAGARHATAAGEPFELAFFVPGTPCTKQRARTSLPREAIERAFVRANGSVAAFRGLLAELRHQTFTPTETRRYEDLVGRCAAAAMRSRAPHAGPVTVVVTCTFEGEDGTWPTGSGDPDVDNVGKAVLDALKGIVWSDDRLVVLATFGKACGGEPGATVTVRDARPA